MAVATRTLYEKVMSHFPRQGVSMAFAYGSGVFKQAGHKDITKNMLDFVFVVENPLQWHQDNLKSNRRHYSFLKYTGASYVSHIQDKYGAGMYFNTLVPCEGRVIKYGVIGTYRLVMDLLDWDSLYASGRLHKPVFMIHRPLTYELTTALQTNLQSSVHTALLLLPETFTEEDLFETITSLSYSGDFRMTVGEDRNKVRNIVRPNMARFRKLYEPIIAQEQHLHWNQSEGLLEQPASPDSQYHHLNLLPKTLLFALVKRLNADGRTRDTEEVTRSLAHDSDCGDFVRQSVTSIVQRSSLTQSIKSAFTAGLLKSCRYSLNKLKKMRGR